METFSYEKVVRAMQTDTFVQVEMGPLPWHTAQAESDAGNKQIIYQQFIGKSSETFLILC